MVDKSGFYREKGNNTSPGLHYTYKLSKYNSGVKELQTKYDTFLAHQI